MGGLFKREKSISELEEETELAEAEDKKVGVELSIAQKRQAIARLKERGLTPKHFGFDWNAIKKFVGMGGDKHASNNP